MAVSWRTLAPRQGQKPVYLIIAYALLLQAFLQTLLGVLRPGEQGDTLAPEPPAAVLTPTDYFSPMADLVEPHGYRLEEHFVTTADGFILRLFRIPGPHTTSASTHSSGSPGSSSRPVVFMMHALMDSSAGWLLLGPGQSLALQLADAGFDVWLGNSRGNRYSRNHTRLQPHEAAFWAWGWDQLAELDLPASISYALAVAGQQQLVYVGYSQGTMIGLAALSSQPQLAASVSLAVLMAPVAFTTAMNSPAFVLSVRFGLDRLALQQPGWGEWGSFQQGNSDAMMPVCRRWPAACLVYLTAFCGSNPSGNIRRDLVPLVFSHLPAGTSVQVMAHWGQSIRRSSTKHLHRFDFGTDCSRSSSRGTASRGTSSRNSSSSSWEPQQQQQLLRPACNQEAYGQAAPLLYDMAEISTPIALFTGGRDTISTAADVELLKQRLAPGVLQLHHHQPDYAHLDYELGTDAPARAYPDVLRLALQFSSSK